MHIYFQKVKYSIMSRSLNNIKGIFWTEDPFVLIQGDNYLNFIPKYESTREEQLNSIVRFCLYFIIITVALQNDEKWLYLPIVMIVVTSLFFYIDKFDSKTRNKRMDKILTDRKKQIKKNKKNKLKNEKESNHFIEDDIDMNESDVNMDDTKTEDNDGITEELEAGFYDSGGNMLVGKKYSHPKPNLDSLDDNVYTNDEILEYQKNTCKLPTRDNPFMNPNITNYNNGTVPVACNSDDDDVQKDIENNFNKDLYRNIEDLWDKKNSQRQFYTLPSTGVPNNQVEFAKWLYVYPETCKESQQNCLRYEDIRFKS